MNKKVVIIMLATLGVLIVGFLAWLIYLQKNKINQIDNTVPATTETASSSSLPIVTKPQPATTSSDDKNPENQEVVIGDTFKWINTLFFNENDASKRLLGYFDRTGLDQKIILDKCDLIHDSTCSADLKVITNKCNLSGEVWSYLPLVFNSSTNTCYTTYADIVDYLNKELDEINRRKQ